MRLSIDPRDTGFDPVMSKRAIVTLDGRVIGDVITADEERGLVHVYDRDIHGSMIPNPVQPTELLTSWHTGKVEISFRGLTLVAGKVAA